MKHHNFLPYLQNTKMEFVQLSCQSVFSRENMLPLFNTMDESSSLQIILFGSIMKTGNRLPRYNYSCRLMCLQVQPGIKAQEESKQNVLASLPCY